MKKNFTVAIIGCGGRGYTYASLLKEKKEFEVVAVCDYNPAQLKKINGILNLPDDKLFLDEKAFFAQKRADIVVIATCDSYHVRQCIVAMRLGCDVLLEKPVSDSRKEISELLSVQKETGKTVVVCHVMRYSVAVKKIDEILSSGVIGKITAIDHFERVRFWHQAQAYVRIQKLYQETQHPTILAKCCHDLDLIQHFVGAKCDTVSSIGGLSHFRPENAPLGATQRCIDCPHIDTCIYSAKKIYIDLWKERNSPACTWPWSKVSSVFPITEESLYNGIRTTVFGECVYKCGVESNPHVVDRQMVQMQFENGVIASLKMLFAAKPGRRINIFGTEGEILFDEQTDSVEVRPYFGKDEVYNISLLSDDSGWGHGGGDAGIINDMYDILTGAKTDYTSLEESVESHLIGIAAEESRLNGGNISRVHGSDID